MTKAEAARINGRKGGRPKRPAAQEPDGKRIGGVTGRGFMPGQSGNPGGRSQAFVTTIKHLCGEDFELLARGFYTIAFGSAKERRAFFGEAVRVTAKDRLRAITELSDRGAGKAIAMVAVDDRPMVPAFALPVIVPETSEVVALLKESLGPEHQHLVDSMAPALAKIVETLARPTRVNVH